MNERPQFRLGVDTQTLLKYLETIPVGEIVSYEVLGNLIGCDVQSDRGSLESARRLLVRDNQIVFGVVRGVGLKRLNPSEVVEQEGETVTKIRRATKRSLKRLASADFDSLSKPDQNKHRLVSATLGAIAVCSSQKAHNRLEQRIQSNGQLDAVEALKLFEKAVD